MYRVLVRRVRSSWWWLLPWITGGSGLCGAEPAAPPRNLLIIQTDEHHFNTLGCYGGSIVKTPHIDWIAKHGALCTSFYATTPVCSPSRAALVSGLYPQKTPVTQNNIPLNDSVVTFAKLLLDAGYATGYAGKWHLEGDGKPQWAPPRKFGFADNRFMFNRGHWKHFADTPTGPRVATRDRQGQPAYGVGDADEQSYATDWLCDKVKAFIEEHHDGPFCYMVSLPDPHGPNTVRAPYDTLYADVDVPLPSTLTRKAEQIPAWGRPANVRPGQLRQLMRKYYGMVKCIDDNVGKLLQTLRQHNILERTLIVFTSDHGDLCGEHGRLNKGVPYEGSARIPFLLYCAEEVPPGTRVDAALTCVDFLPTVMSLLQVDVPHRVDGRNAASLFRGESEPWHDFAVVRSTSGKTPWISAITADYKLVLSAVDEPWLFHVREDPQELENLYAQPEHRLRIETLLKGLRQYGREHQDPFLRVPGIASRLNIAP